MPLPGQAWTVKAWLEHWLVNIAQPSLRHSSFNAYRFAVEKHLVPALGRQRMNRLEPEHLERLYQAMIEAGARPGTAHQVHRTMRTALGEAFRRGYVSRNVAEVAKPPRVQPDPVEPFTVEEMRRILDAALTRRTVRDGPLPFHSGCVRARRWVCGGATSTSRRGRCGCARRCCVRCISMAAAGRVVDRSDSARTVCW